MSESNNRDSERCDHAGTDLPDYDYCPYCGDPLDGESRQLTAEDLRVKATDEGPVLEIDGELSVLLRTVVAIDEDESFEASAETFRTDVDSDLDGAWWIIWPDDGELHPTVTIQPEVIKSD